MEDVVYWAAFTPGLWTCSSGNLLKVRLKDWTHFKHFGKSKM